MGTGPDFLAGVGSRLDAMRRPFMLTRSVALACFATPRTTRKLDIVPVPCEHDLAPREAKHACDDHVEVEVARGAIRSERRFHLLHLACDVEVDMVVRKASVDGRVSSNSDSPSRSGLRAPGS